MDPDASDWGSVDSSGRTTESRPFRRRAIKATRFRIRTLLIVIGLAAVVMAGIAFALRRPGRPYSAVFSRFDPVAILSSQPGISVEGVAGSGTFHKRAGGAFREWRGFVKAADGRPIPPVIQRAIQGYLQAECQGGTLVSGDLTDHATEQSSPARVASHGLFLFNEGDRHGELHVWLFPDSSGSGLGYAIGLVEEPLE